MTIALDAIAHTYRRHIERPPVPGVGQDVRYSYRLAGEWYEVHAYHLALTYGIGIIPTDNPEPYPDAATMALWTRQTRRFYVSRAYCDHEGWTPAQNVAYRVVHDMIGHAILDRRTPHDDVPAFTTEGELLAWRLHLSHLRKLALIPEGYPYANVITEHVIPVTFTEHLGQLGYCHTFGSFPSTGPDDPQRPALLPFDYDAEVIL